MVALVKLESRVMLGSKVKKDYQVLQDKEESGENQGRMDPWAQRAREVPMGQTDTLAVREARENWEIMDLMEAKVNLENLVLQDPLYHQEQKKDHQVRVAFLACPDYGARTAMLASLGGLGLAERLVFPASPDWLDHQEWSWMEQEEFPASLEGMVFLELMVEEDSKVPKAKMVEMVSLAWDSREWRACPESEVDPGDPEEAEILVIQVLRVFLAMGLPLREEEAARGLTVPGVRPACRVFLAFPAPLDSKVQREQTAASVPLLQMERRVTLETLGSPESQAFLDHQDLWVQMVAKVWLANQV